MNGYDGSTIKPFIEPLTRREREILALLREGLTSQEIAERLILAVSSVRWYIQQIYSKLGVNSKRQALERSRALGLLKPALRLPEPFTHQGSKHNLPRQLTSFISREKEIVQVKNLVREYPLVTLTGSGGVGKTRLLLRAAEEVLADYPDGVWYVELAPLADPALVSQQVAFTLGVGEEPNRPILDSLASYLHSRQALLVLDNCEHLLDACVRLADRLLRDCSRLKILASSREPLGVTGEAIFRVPSLPFPDPGQAFELENLDRYAAIRLFVDRARLVLTDYRVTLQNAPSLARICQRLDGIPLAIELAAARTAVLTAEQLADRLDDSFRLLTGGSRTALPRQQTLQATIDWSYNLLSEPERTLLRRLSVFAGGWELEAAEQICSDTEESKNLMHPSGILDLLVRLVNKSMVNVDREQSTEARYWLLETIRQYAREKLRDSGEMNELRLRHLDYFLKWSEDAEPKLHGAEQAVWYARLESNLENVRQALEWGLETDPPAAMRLAHSLFFFWLYTNHIKEGFHWLEACLQKPENTDRTVQRGRALVNLSALASWTFEHSQDQWKWAQEGLDICQELKDPFGQALAHATLGYMTNWYSDNYPDIKAHYETSLKLFQSIGDRWWEARIYVNLADMSLFQGETSAHKSYLEQCLKIYRELNDERGIAICLERQALILSMWEGNFRKGRELCEQALEILQRLKLIRLMKDDREVLAWIALWQGDYQLASDIMGKLVEYLTQSGDTYTLLFEKEFIGRIMAFQGLYEQAVELLEKVFYQSIVLFPQGSFDLHRTIVPSLAYALANLNQLERAKAIMNRIDWSNKPIYPYEFLFFTVPGYLAFQEGNALESARHYRESLEFIVKEKFKLGELLVLEGHAGALHLLGCHPEAVQLLAAAYAFREQIGSPIWTSDQAYLDRVRLGLRAQMGEDGFQRYWKAGETISLDQAATLALSIPL